MNRASDVSLFGAGVSPGLHACGEVEFWVEISAYGILTAETILLTAVGRWRGGRDSRTGRQIQALMTGTR